jgi:general secretion pathway protein L
MSRLLGIDASKSSVRVAVLHTSYRKLTLESLAEVDIATVGSEVLAIRAAIAGIKPDAAAIALSGEKSFYRRLDLPAAAQKEIASVLGFELEATVPFEMEEAVFDYRLLKLPSATAPVAEGEATIPLFTAVARIADVRERISTVSQAIGIEPVRVGTGPLPLANLGSVMPEVEQHLGPVALLDLGDQTSDMLIVSGGDPVFARTLSRGTRGLPESAPALARELRQTLAAFRTQGGAPIAAMYLVGGGAIAAGAETFLGTELGVSILPLPRPRFEGLTEDHATRLPRFAKAVALAFGLSGRGKGLNLRRGPLEAEQSYPFLREKIPLLAGLAAVIVVSFGFSMVAELQTLDAEHARLSARLAAASRDILGTETDEPDKARELLDQGPGKADEDPLPYVDAFDAMTALSRAVPKEVVHDIVEFDVSRGHVIIQGTVPSVGDAETIAKNMKDNHCFKDPKISRTSQYTEGKQKYVLEFEFKCEEKKKKPEGTPADSAAAAAGSAKLEGGK